MIRFHRLILELFQFEEFEQLTNDTNVRRVVNLLPKCPCTPDIVYLTDSDNEFFRLDENNGKTRVRYSYEGFSEMDDSYSNMNFSSAKYLESLRQYCQTGKGEAFGSPSYRS